MKIDLVSRYFKPLKYSENVIRYVPKLPLSLLLLVASQTTAPIIFPPICNTLYLLARRPFRTNSKFLSTIVSQNEGQNKHSMKSVAVEKKAQELSKFLSSLNEKSCLV